MIDKTITLITVTWGDYIKIGNMVLGHSLAQFPYFTKVHNFTHINNLEDYINKYPSYDINYFNWTGDYINAREK